jgi:hypothetical protein
VRGASSALLPLGPPPKEHGLASGRSIGDQRHQWEARVSRSDSYPLTTVYTSGAGYGELRHKRLRVAEPALARERRHPQVCDEGWPRWLYLWLYLVFFTLKWMCSRLPDPELSPLFPPPFFQPSSEGLLD